MKLLVVGLLFLMFIGTGVGCNDEAVVSDGKDNTKLEVNETEAAATKDGAAMWVDGEYEDIIEIISFDPPRGVHFSGESIAPSVTFKYLGAEDKEIWVGCSFQDPTGKWYDLPAVPLLFAGGDTKTQEMPWEIPGELVSGRYKTVLALWDSMPAEGSVRLAHGEGADDLLLYREEDDFEFFNDEVWEKTTSRLGRSSLRQENVTLDGGILKIHLPTGTVNGGEIRTKELQSFGAYEIRMKVPRAPSSITGFFLYRAPDYDHEIDIEIFNEKNGDIFFTTYADGAKQNEYLGPLPFDPTAAFHTYRIEYDPDQVSFYVDDVLMQQWFDGFSREPMYLMVNCWYPRWLDGIPAGEDNYLEIDWIRY